MRDACGIAVAEGRNPVALAVELAALRDNGDPPRRHRPPVGCPLMDALLAETATRILSDLADSPESLWTALEDNGLTRVWAAEADGGFDLAPADGFGLMRLAGAHAAPVPLADTLMASWFLTEAKLPVPPGKNGLLIDGWARCVRGRPRPAWPTWLCLRGAFGRRLRTTA